MAVKLKTNEASRGKPRGIKRNSPKPPILRSSSFGGFSAPSSPQQAAEYSATENKTKKRQSQNPAKERVKTRRKPVAKKAVRSVSVSTMLKAEDLGVSTDYLVGRAMTETASMIAPAEVPENLPVVDFTVDSDSEVKVYTPLSIHRPLVGHRTSFWIGVGFGVFVVGVLAILAWQLTRASVVEAVVVGLTGL